MRSPHNIMEQSIWPDDGIYRGQIEPCNQLVNCRLMLMRSYEKASFSLFNYGYICLKGFSTMRKRSTILKYLQI